MIKRPPKIRMKYPNLTSVSAAHYLRKFSVRFFSGARVHRILQAVISGEADQAVSEALQRELDVETIPLPHWPNGSMVNKIDGWLKARMLDCFDPHRISSLLENKQESGASRVTIGDLITLPLRDPYHELECFKSDETISPDRRQFLLSLSAEEKAHIMLLNFSLMELGAKVGVVAPNEKAFIKENMTDEETSHYHWAINRFHF